MPKTHLPRGILEISHDVILPDLQDVSPKDKVWDIHKRNAVKVAYYYAEIGYSRLSERVLSCANTLGFVLRPDSRNGKDFKLADARFCRVRLCPICQWRKSLMWRARFLGNIPKVLKDYPNHRFLFLTLTVKNCPLEELRETLAWMNKAWGKMTRRKNFPAVGWVKSVEVTLGNDGNAHPHFHSVLMVPTTYFKGTHYLSQKAWCELWKSCLMIDYQPMVHIKALKPKFGCSEDVMAHHTSLIEKALIETLKYSVKESDLVVSPEWLKGLTNQLEGTKSVSLGGIFKKYLKETDPQNLINSEDSDGETLPGEDRFWFGWHNHVKRYKSK